MTKNDTGQGSTDTGLTGPDFRTLVWSDHQRQRFESLVQTTITMINQLSKAELLVVRLLMLNVSQTERSRYWTVLKS